MKNTILAIAMLASFCASAQVTTNAVDNGPKTWVTELTLSGAGFTTKHGTEFGFSVSYETNPFKPLPSLWVEVIQGVAWQPTFAGTTDLVSEWAWPLYKDVLYLNTGWNFGVAYDVTTRPLWRTGPEFTVQYFIGNSAFIYAGITFDCFVSRGDISLRPGLGLGITF